VPFSSDQIANYITPRDRPNLWAEVVQVVRIWSTRPGRIVVDCSDPHFIVVRVYPL